MGAAVIGEIKVVGKSGQISLGKRHAGRRLELQVTAGQLTNRCNDRTVATTRKQLGSPPSTRIVTGGQP